MSVFVILLSSLGYLLIGTAFGLWLVRLGSNALFFPGLEGSTAKWVDDREDALTWFAIGLLLWPICFPFVGIYQLFRTTIKALGDALLRFGKAHK